METNHNTNGDKMSHYPDIENADYLCDLREITVQGFGPVRVAVYRCIGGEVVGVWHATWADDDGTEDEDSGYLRDMVPNYDAFASLELRRVLATV